MIDDMLEHDTIRPSNSPWASPIVLVKKKDGSTRFCVDFRRVNEISRKDAYPIPRIDDTLSSLSGAQYFSTLDLPVGTGKLKLKIRIKKSLHLIRRLDYLSSMSWLLG